MSTPSRTCTYLAATPVTALLEQLHIIIIFLQYHFLGFMFLYITESFSSLCAWCAFPFVVGAPRWKGWLQIERLAGFSGVSLMAVGIL